MTKISRSYHIKIVHTALGAEQVLNRYITSMYLSHKYTILQIMQASGHKPQKTVIDYSKLPSEEIPDEMKLANEFEVQVWL